MKTKYLLLSLPMIAPAAFWFSMVFIPCSDESCAWGLFFAYLAVSVFSALVSVVFLLIKLWRWWKNRKNKILAMVDPYESKFGEYYLIAAALFGLFQIPLMLLISSF